MSTIEPASPAGMITAKGGEADQWLSPNDVLSVTGWSLRVLQSRTPKLETRATRRCARNGKQVLKYRLRSLPRAAQLKWREREGALAKAEAEQSPMDERPKVAFASEAEELQARERLAIIEPLAALARGNEVRLSDGTAFVSAAKLRAHLAQQHGTDPSTIFRWLQRYQKCGLVGLADRQRSDKGKSRFFEQYSKAAVHDAYVYLVQRRSVRIAWEAICRDRELLGVPAAELPSYTTVRLFLNAIPPTVQTLARSGYREYRERMAPYVRRGYIDVPANDIWVSDHMIHDVECANDCFFDAPAGTPIRIRFTALIDFRSRMVVGASWAWEGSSRSITTALRHAVMQHGPAAMLYCDNGKDYLKGAKGAMPGYLRSEIEPAEWYRQELQQLQDLGVLARLGMAVQHCIVRHPQSKHIERFFGFVHERLDKSFPTYTGGSPSRRPDVTTEAMALHRKLLRMGRSNESLHPRASQFIQAALAWLHWYNTEHKHSGEGMDGRTPAEVFAEHRGTERPRPEPRDLAMMLLEREQRKVRECAVTLNKRRYIGADETARCILHELNECDVVIAYDPLDPEDAAVLDLQGNLLTFAHAEKLLPQSSAAGDAIAQSMRERRRMEKDTAAFIVGLRDVARENGAVSEVEHMAKRAQSNVLPMAVGEFVTQRTPRIRPDDNAVAPPTPGESARRLIAMEAEE